MGVMVSWGGWNFTPRAGVGGSGAAPSLGHNAETRADLLRRQAHGTWPDNAVMVTAGDLTIDSIEFTAPLAAFSRTA
jgi:hypothetical protein